MLLSLHVATAFETTEEWVRAFLLAHYGFFLLWQPLLQGQKKLETRLAIPVLGIAAILILFPG